MAMEGPQDEQRADKEDEDEEAEKYLKGLSMWQANKGNMLGLPNSSRNQGILGVDSCT